MSAARTYPAEMAKQKAPGWRKHPDLKGVLRYWDGEEWTDDVASMYPPGGPSLGTIVLGILLAALVIGIVVAALAAG